MISPAPFPDAAPLAFGTMRLAGAPPAQVRALLEATLEAGLTLVDTAPIYGACGPGFGDVESRLGAAFAEAPGMRDRIVLVTKAGIEPGMPYDSSAGALRASCEASLRRMGTDRIDLFLIHRPDVLTGPAEVAEALDRLVADGLVGAVGVSNHTPAQVSALAHHMEAPLVANQVEVSPLAIGALFDGTLDQCQEREIVPMA
ncbi:aldo/keto reductase [Jannaschia seohaensis]|uniref:Aldo/keto reductase family protein n=1 Tax=Jannaschia seohaensis TaxID=475081 RepID=A0A2Y9A3U5_9RHOB|nr:aldo/keto reductase [Jannaschia seohaensis]PWJ22258.1 aldo/keto reductase family protein [Jannaschia seohaensis]SSA38536.1 Aldo/keto reductase family protein [Jannaschia seohaensis]